MYSASSRFSAEPAILSLVACACAIIQLHLERTFRGGARNLSKAKGGGKSRRYHDETEERVGEQDGHESRWALLALQRPPSRSLRSLLARRVFPDDIIAMNKKTRGGRGRGRGGARGVGQKRPWNRQAQVSSSTRRSDIL